MTPKKRNSTSLLFSCQGDTFSACYYIYSLAGLYDNPILQSTVYSKTGTKNLVSGSLVACFAGGGGGASQGEKKGGNLW
jgi:hypothetical protein